MNYTSWRKPYSHVEYRAVLGRPTDVEPCQMFDNLYFIGNTAVGCFLIKTSDGYVMIDNMYPFCNEFIEKSIIKLGIDPHEVKHILISHGHGDHYGNAVYFREKYGTKLWMSQIDEAYAQDASRFPKGKLPMQFNMDGYLTDGMKFIFGDTTIETFHTPGHTPGCMSFIFKVYDEGREHICSEWGGTGVPREATDKGPSSGPVMVKDLKTLIASCRRFSEICLDKGCDVAISTHPFVDNTIERLDVLRRIVDGVPNPFVIGYEGFHRFEKMYMDMYADALAKEMHE